MDVQILPTAVEPPGELRYEWIVGGVDQDDAFLPVSVTPQQNAKIAGTDGQRKAGIEALALHFADAERHLLWCQAGTVDEFGG